MNKRIEDGQVERRFCAAPALRAIREDGKPSMLIGYAAVFGKPSERMMGWDGDFVEYVDTHAFDRTLKDGDDVQANVGHSGGVQALGRNTAGTLKLAVDNIGLRSEIMVPNTQAGRDILELVGRGDLSKMSFAFQTITDRVERAKERGEPDVRTLLEVKLFDVSIVDRPAYPDTSVAVRSLREILGDRCSTDTLRRRLDLELLDNLPVMV